jgi:SAP domain-containing new25/Domain of unknown function (DUF6434)
VPKHRERGAPPPAPAGWDFRYGTSNAVDRWEQVCPAPPADARVACERLTTTERPALSSDLSSAEFLRWYWLKSELLQFARSHGVGTAGDKPALTQRIALFLAGADVPGQQKHAARMTVSTRIAEPSTLDTVIGARQAASQQLRAFFVQVIGHRFSYDIHMRTFLASDRTKTLGEAVDHWYASRGSLKPETLPQLEFVRFTKAWHVSNPNSSQVECRAAWKRHRSLPVDQRPPID